MKRILGDPLHTMSPDMILKRGWHVPLEALRPLTHGCWQAQSVFRPFDSTFRSLHCVNVVNYPCTACLTGSTVCSGFTLQWITAGKWSPDAALSGSNSNSCTEWLNVEIYISYDSDVGWSSHAALTHRSCLDNFIYFSQLSYGQKKHASFLSATSNAGYYIMWRICVSC